MGRHKKKDTVAPNPAEKDSTEQEKPKKRVLDLSDDEAEGDISTLKVNKKFAKEFHERHKIQELKRLAEKYGDSEDEDDEESDSEEEDSEGVLAAEAAEDFLEILPKLAMHDPSVLRKDVKFFGRLNAEDDDAENDGDGEKTQPHTKKEKKTTYKDLVRESILTKMRRADSEADAAASDSDDAPPRKRTPASGLSIAEEERLAREEFLRAANDDAEEEEEEEEEGMLRKRVKSAAEREAEENEYKQFLERRQAQDRALLEKFWIEKSDADANEKFLRDYIINKAWIEKDGDTIPTYDEIVGDGGDGGGDDDDDADAEDIDEEDAELDELQDQFEHAYNFRFEEPGGTELVSHVRAQIESVRAPDVRRKEKRKRRQERKERERKQRQDEKNRLQHLKRAEIEAKLRELQRISGLSKDKMAALLTEDEFDAAAWDAHMEQMFDDAYYNDPEYEKPDFGDAAAAADDDARDAVTPNWEKEARRVVDRVRASAASDDAAQQQAQELEKALEDYYKLDYEDIVGGMPVRFKYTRVEPVSYGLNAVDILLADDRELNRYVPLKKLAPYREDQGKFKKSGKARGKRKRAAQAAADTDAPEEERPNASRKRARDDNDAAADATAHAEPLDATSGEGDAMAGAPPKKKRRRRNKNNAQE